MRLMRENLRGNWVGALKRHSPRACAKPCNGTWTTRPGWKKLHRALTRTGFMRTTAIAVKRLRPPPRQVRDEGDHSRGRFRHAPASDYASRLQAASADL